MSIRTRLRSSRAVDASSSAAAIGAMASGSRGSTSDKATSAAGVSGGMSCSAPGIGWISVMSGLLLGHNKRSGGAFQWRDARPVDQSCSWRVQHRVIRRRWTAPWGHARCERQTPAVAKGCSPRGSRRRTSPMRQVPLAALAALGRSISRQNTRSTGCSGFVLDVGRASVLDVGTGRSEDLETGYGQT